MTHKVRLLATEQSNRSVRHKLSTNTDSAPFSSHASSPGQRSPLQRRNRPHMSVSFPFLTTKTHHSQHKPDIQNQKITTIQHILNILTRRHLFHTSHRIHASLSTPSHPSLHPSDPLPSILTISKTLASLNTTPSTVPAALPNTFTSFLIPPVTWLASASLVALLAPVAWLACTLVTFTSFSQSSSLLPSPASSSQQVEVIGAIPAGRKSILLSKSNPPIHPPILKTHFQYIRCPQLSFRHVRTHHRSPHRKKRHSKTQSRPLLLGLRKLGKNETSLALLQTHPRRRSAPFHPHPKHPCARRQLPSEKSDPLRRHPIPSHSLLILSWGGQRQHLLLI